MRLRTHCARGHEFTPENTRLGKRDCTFDGRARECRECIRLAKARHYQRLKERGIHGSRPVPTFADVSNSTMKTCKSGRHAWSSENVIVKGKANICRPCANERTRMRRKLRKAHLTTGQKEKTE